MIQSFKNAGTEDVFNGKNTVQARRVCPQQLWRVAARKLDQLDSVHSLEELRIPPGNQLEALKGERKGQHSNRINDQFRVCFTWTDGEPAGVEIVDYHWMKVGYHEVKRNGSHTNTPRSYSSRRNADGGVSQTDGPDSTAVG